jgi:hypothetical protein
VLSREATNTNFIVFGLTRPGLEPTHWSDPLFGGTFRTLSLSVIHSASGIKIQSNIPFIAITQIMRINSKKKKWIPPNKGSDQYTQWISGLWRETAKIFDQEARRFFATCRGYLDVGSVVLIM